MRSNETVSSTATESSVLTPNRSVKFSEESSDDVGAGSGAWSRETPNQHPLIEIGWLSLGPFKASERRMLKEAQSRFSHELSNHFPEFEWRQRLAERPASTPDRADTIDLLDEGLRLLHERRWDFAFVVTGSEMPRDASTPIAAVSRAMGVASLSIEQIGSADERSGALLRMALHLFGDLNGLAHAADPASIMFPPGDPNADTTRSEFAPAELRTLGQRLTEVADVRVEEDPRTRRADAWRFYAHTVRVAWREVVRSVAQARPWELPARLPRLSAGAASALVILLLTAEAWELGQRQALGTIALLSVGCLALMSTFLIRRQNLLLRSTRRTERYAIANLTVVLVVALGLLTTYLVLFGVVVLTAHALVGEELLVAWAPTLSGRPTTARVLAMSGFAATTGLVIGALGASFEGSAYFRRVAFVDEEVE